MTFRGRLPRHLSDPLLLLQAQLAGIGLWHGARHALEREVAGLRPDDPASRSAQRRLALRAREAQAMQAHLSVALLAALDPLPVVVGPRAVVACRAPGEAAGWSAGLRREGVEVVCVTADPAEAVGVAVAEQPSLLVLDAGLAEPGASYVLGQVRTCSPWTLVVVWPSADAGAPGLQGDLLAPGGPEEVARVLAATRTGGDARARDGA